MIYHLPLQLNSCETLNKSYNLSVMLFCIFHVKLLWNNEGKTTLGWSMSSINVRLILWLLILLFDLEPEGWTGLQSWRTIGTEVAIKATGSRVFSRSGSRKRDLSRILWEEHNGKDLEPGCLGVYPDSAIYKLCALEQALQSLCAPVFSPLRWGWY